LHRLDSDAAELLCAAAIPTFRILTLSFPLLLNYALTHCDRVSGKRWYCNVRFSATRQHRPQHATVPALSIDGAAWATLGTEVF
jgi:hypothetical protein